MRRRSATSPCVISDDFAEISAFESRVIMPLNDTSFFYRRYQLFEELFARDIRERWGIILIVRHVPDLLEHVAVRVKRMLNTTDLQLIRLKVVGARGLTGLASRFIRERGPAALVAGVLPSGPEYRQS